MSNFESEELKRQFDKIVFGDLAGANAPWRSPDLAAAHAGVTAAPGAANVKVAKASGPNARTVAEIVTGRAALKDKTVLVRDRNVKYNPGILGTYWIHLRDGTGSAAPRTNDLLVTGKSETKIGNVLLVKGVVRTDKDFGAGYSCQVVIEAAELAGK